MPAGGGPPGLHRHPSAEVYRVEAGELALYAEDEDGDVRPTVAGSGGVVHIPGCRAHTARNESGAEACAYVVFVPGAEMEGFARAVARLAAAGPAAPRGRRGARPGLRDRPRRRRCARSHDRALAHRTPRVRPCGVPATASRSSPSRSAAAPRLRRADCTGPGLRRRKHGRGFVYLDPDGDRIEDAEVLHRIHELVIPPAWEDVWICPYPGGHIQATGIDQAGRKQYLYHPRWRARRDQEKFEDMVVFARALPALREHVEREMEAGDDLGRRRVLACSVRLLDRGFFRVGGEDYAVTNRSYGLATMLKRHVRLRDDVLVFDYPAKSGKRRVQAVVDPLLADVVGRLKARRGGGPELLAYKDGRRWVDVRSDDINEYLKDATGLDISAKDFRTWGATVLAAVALAVSGEVAATKTGRKRAISRAVKEVAHYLGNTPAVARASYIDPRVFDRYRDGVTIGGALSLVAENGDAPAIQGPVEEAVLELIE
jgi:DNA topoisomerase-1